MNEEGRATPVSPPEQKTSAGAGPSLTPPSFDSRSVRRARPAVPLARAAAGRTTTLTWAAVALVAGMCGGLLGILTLNAYQNREAARPAVGSAPATASRDANAPATPAEVTNENVAPPPTDTSRASVAAKPQEAGDEADAAARPDETAATATATNGDESGQLRGALAAWVAATNARDIERQMDFYDTRVGVYYLSRNASRAAVRAEKTYVFKRASTVEVSAGEPQINVSPDGRAATMRFRKQYAIEGAGVERRGAVLQELRWRRTPAGWKITGERDLRVVE